MRSPLPWPLDILAGGPPRPAGDLVLHGAALSAAAYAGVQGWAAAGELLPYLALLVALDLGRIAARRARHPARHRPTGIPALWIFRGDPPPGWIFTRPAAPPSADPALLALRIWILYGPKIRTADQLARDLFRGDIA